MPPEILDSGPSDFFKKNFTGVSVNFFEGMTGPGIPTGIEKPACHREYFRVEELCSRLKPFILGKNAVNWFF